jgi:hypothetical protein
MTIEDRQTTIQTEQRSGQVATTPGGDPQGAAIQSRDTVSRRSVVVQASNAEMARRIVVLVFGLIQAVIILRIVLLLLDARTGNALVSGILDISQIFVAPFAGILNVNALKSGGSVLDVAALVAIIGWTLLEVGIFAVINLFRRGSAFGGANV